MKSIWRVTTLAPLHVVEKKNWQMAEGDWNRKLWQKLKRAYSSDAERFMDSRVGPVSKWSSVAQIEMRKRRPLLDMVYVPAPFNVVSDRFRCVLEEAAPGDIQFLPVRPSYRGVLLDVAPYWIALSLRRVDAMHLGRADVGEYELYKGTVGSRADCVINPDLVPAKVHAFTLQYQGASRIFVDERLCKAIRKAKLQGVYLWKQLTAHENARARRKIRPYVKMRTWTNVPTFEPAPLPPAKLELHRNGRRTASSEANSATAFRQFLGRGSEAAVEVGSGARLADIRAAEKKLGLKLPASYKDFLRSCGTATVEGEEVFGIPSKRTETDFVKTTLDLRKVKNRSWPLHAVAIADDGRGGSFCLDTSKIKGDDCPVVYHDHELDEVDRASGVITPNFERVGRTFKGWLRHVAKNGCMLPDR